MLGCSLRTVQNYCDENKIISYRNVKNRRLVDKDKLKEVKTTHDFSRKTHLQTNTQILCRIR